MMKRFMAFLAVCCIASAASCGSDSQRYVPATQLDVNSALAELNRLEAPAGGNPEQFAELKSALASALRSSGARKFTSAAPGGASGAVADLTFVASGGFWLEWTYRNKGDYDQNRQVTISDLSALGANLGKSPVSPDWLSKALAADGDANSEVNIADITPIGANLLATVTGYKIQTTDTPATESSWHDFDEVSFESSSIPPGSALRRFSYNFAPSPGSWYRVVPIDGASRGAASNAVQYALSAPNITGVVPQTGLAGAAVTFTAVNTGGTPTSWDWDFGGGAAPNTSTQVQPTVTLGAAGNYNASLTVSNAAGSDTFNFPLLVTNPDPPVIEDVQPQSGTEGAGTSFTATVSGGPIATYAWDFGGGATPNTDNAITPFVTLSAAGIYPVSLTVSNAGGSDTFNFNLSVTPAINNAPTASFTATPSNGNPGDPVQLDASASSDSDGTIATYEWDLNNDGSYELSETDPLASTTLPNPEGTVDVTLRVTDNGGAEDLATRTLSSVVPTWHVTTVINTSEGVMGPPMLAEVNGLPRIAFGEDTFTGKIYPAFAYTDTDDASNSWSTLWVDDIQPAKMSLASINNKAAIAFTSSSDGDLRYAFTTRDDGSGDWTALSIDDLSAAESVSLANINGKPAIAYHGGNTLKYIHSTTADGNGPWISLDIDSNHALGASLALINGKPAIAYYAGFTLDTRKLTFAYSSQDDGSFGWAIVPINVTQGLVDWTKVSLTTVNGFPAILWGTPAGAINYAYSITVDGGSQWSTLDTQITVDPAISLPQALAFAGYPYSALISPADQVNLGVNDSADGTGTWTESLVDKNAASSVTIAIINGHPAIAYQVGIGEIRYAIYK